VEELPTPTPKGAQLLVKVRYASVNPVDWKMREGRNKLVLNNRWPKVLGHDFAGEVVATGPRAKRFKVGDAVYGMQGLAMGAYATHVLVSEKIVAAKPASLSFEEAAALPMTSLTALQVLRDIVGLRAGQKLLVNGASGGVGSSAVQLGKVLGAEVTGVCSARNAALVRGLGADHVVDYGQEDFRQGDVTYDVVFDCVGNTTLAECAAVLSPRGAFASVKTDPLKLLSSRVCNLFRGQRDTQILVALPRASDLTWISGQVASGAYRPVIDRSFPLADIQQAHTHSESGRARGKLTIEMPG
jgi:NADPH:quinone reductase-like Zn-dependent oxidoreductase